MIHSMFPSWLAWEYLRFVGDSTFVEPVDDMAMRFLLTARSSLGGSFCFAFAHCLLITHGILEGANDGTLALALRVDVNGDCNQEDEALNDLRPVGADAHQLKAIVQEGHDERANHGAHDRANTTGNGGTTDEHGGNGVEFPCATVSRTRGRRTADEQHSRNRGEECRVADDEEVRLDDLHTGQFCRSLVATDGVN